MKKKIVFLFTLGMLLTPGLQAFASGGDCDTYNTTLFSGIETTIASEDNHTYNAAISYSNGDLSCFQTKLINDDKSIQSSYRDLYKGHVATFTNVANYTGQRILAKGIKYNITGAMHVSGRFYYDGL